MSVRDIQDLGLTRQREVVLKVIREADEHLTVNEVFAMAKAMLSSISFATVYNSLRYLKEAGLVHEISFGDCASRYDGVMERHDHAICNQCGKLVDLDMPEAAKLMPAAARKSRFKPQSVHFTLRGVCPDCCGPQTS